MRRYCIMIGALCFSFLFCSQAAIGLAAGKAAFDFTKVKAAYCAAPVVVAKNAAGQFSDEELESVFLKQMKALHISVLSRTDIEKKAQRREGITQAYFAAMKKEEKERIFEQYLPVYAELMIVPQILDRKKVAFEVVEVKSQRVVYQTEIEAVLNAKKLYTQQELYAQMIQKFSRKFNRIL